VKYVTERSNYFPLKLVLCTTSVLCSRNAPSVTIVKRETSHTPAVALAMHWSSSIATWIQGVLRSSLTGGNRWPDRYLHITQTWIYCCPCWSIAEVPRCLNYNKFIKLNPRHCATSRKVACPIPDGVIGIFHWLNPSGRTMALGLTQPLTEMSTRSIFSGVKAAGA
jgi:hypothetical protein